MDKFLIMMKRIFIFALWAAAAIMAAMTQSCQKSPINGDLDGQWQVMEVNPEPTGTPVSSRLYYCFYLHVCQLNYYDGTLATGNMDYSGNRITLSFPTVSSDDTAANEGLRQYGIGSNPATFKVESLDSRHLVMRDGETTVTLRKF